MIQITEMVAALLSATPSAGLLPNLENKRDEFVLSLFVAQRQWG